MSGRLRAWITLGGDDQTARSPILCASAFNKEPERVLLYSRKPRNARLPAGKRYLPTLITRQDRRPGFERNGNATVPLLHPPLAHFYDEHPSSQGLRATISHQT